MNRYSISIRMVDGNNVVEPCVSANEMQKRHDEMMAMRRTHSPIKVQFHDMAGRDGEEKRHRQNVITILPEHIVSLSCRIEESQVPMPSLWTEKETEDLRNG